MKTIRNADILKRYNETFSLLMIDLDDFKDINDSHGHPAGDRILKGVAFKIKQTLRDSDFVARFGGDEFALILMKADALIASDMAWQLCVSLRKSRFLLDDIPVTVTLSIGVAEADVRDTEETLLKRADEALYRLSMRDATFFFWPTNRPEAMTTPASRLTDKYLVFEVPINVDFAPCQPLKPSRPKCVKTAHIHRGSADPVCLQRLAGHGETCRLGQ